MWIRFFNIEEIFNLNGIQFPIGLSDISKFEKLNLSISVNVYGFNSDWEIEIDHFNLLCLESNGTV